MSDIPSRSMSPKQQAVTQILLDRGEELLGDKGVDAEVAIAIAGEIIKALLPKEITDGRYVVYFWLKHATTWGKIAAYASFSDAAKVAEDTAALAVIRPEIGLSGVKFVDTLQKLHIAMMIDGELV